MEAAPWDTGDAHGGRDRGRKRATRARRDQNSRRVRGRRALTQSNEASARVFCRVGRSCFRARASTGGEGCAGISPNQGREPGEKMPRVATLTFNGRRRSRSSRSLLPGVRATFCEVCRSNGDVRGRRLDCDAPAHLEAGYLSPRGGVNPPRRGLFFNAGTNRRFTTRQKPPRVIPD